VGFLRWTPDDPRIPTDCKDSRYWPEPVRHDSDDDAGKSVPGCSALLVSGVRWIVWTSMTSS
jgi:hypothetical protein